MKVKVVQQILKANDALARQNKRIFDEHNLYVINLLGSPGAGKTSLLEKMIGKFDHLKIGVIEGDIATSQDADRIARLHAPVVQINTRGACHLDANMVQGALSEIDLKELHGLVIENVGNLVCPAGFNLGEDDKILVLSVTEGADKPSKYPAMFQESSVLIINKQDLVPYVEFDVEKCVSDALKINPDLEIFKVSCKTGEGLEDWFRWVRSKISAKHH